MDGSYPGRCGSCAAFTRMWSDPARGPSGTCALEIYPPPVSASSTCSRYRPRGAPAPAPRPRAAGEPRGQRTAAVLPTSPRAAVPVAERPSPSPSPPLPEEIELDMDLEAFRRVLREVLAEELGVSRVELGARWQGGELILRPGREGTAEKRVPLDTFFHKIVMVRDKLRLLEAKVNAHETLSDEEKVQLQAYITGCYGSLTTFNVLFAQREDGFTGAGGD